MLFRFIRFHVLIHYLHVLFTSCYSVTRTFTTEILEGFDVQRTRDTNETVQKYGELTHAIVDRYSSEVGKPGEPLGGKCQRYVEFLEHCKDIEMERVTDVFGVQLMQVSWSSRYCEYPWCLC